MEMSMVAEGYYATKSAYQLNMKREKNAKTPIINAVYAILYESGNAKDIFKDLTNKLD